MSSEFQSRQGHLWVAGPTGFHGGLSPGVNVVKLSGERTQYCIVSEVGGKYVLGHFLCSQTVVPV